MIGPAGGMPRQAFTRRHMPPCIAAPKPGWAVDIPNRTRRRDAHASRNVHATGARRRFLMTLAPWHARSSTASIHAKRDSKGRRRMLSMTPTPSRQLLQGHLPAARLTTTPCRNYSCAPSAGAAVAAVAVSPPFFTALAANWCLRSLRLRRSPALRRMAPRGVAFSAVSS